MIKPDILPLKYACLIPRLFALLSLSASSVAWAANSAPIRANNSLPIMQGSGLAYARPASISKASSTERHETRSEQISVLIDLALQSHANIAASSLGNERLTIDSEALSLDAELRWQVAPDWQAAVTLGVLRHRSGRLDSVIRDWHDLISVSQGDREQLVDDEFTLAYLRGEQATTLSQQVSGVTDTEISIAYQLHESPRWQLAAYLFANLPTGNTEKLTGSDATDYGASLAWASNTQARFGWHTYVSMHKIGDDRLFGINTQDYVWQVNAGVHWHANDKLRCSVQLDGHAAVFDSEIEEISREAWQLSLAVEFAERWQLHFSEDLSVNRAADFSIGVSWHSGF